VFHFYFKFSLGF